MSTYKLTCGECVEYVSAQNEGQLAVIATELFHGDTYKVEEASQAEVDSLIRAHSCPIGEC